MTIATTLPKATHSKKEIPRGRPVSGRTWKKVQKTRFSSMKTKATTTLSSTWEEKLEKKSKLKELKDRERDMKDRKKKKLEDQRKAREDREKRRQENQMKAIQVQTISKLHKLKTMSKKQLRQIKKTRVNSKGVTEYVGLYEK